MERVLIAFSLNSSVVRSRRCVGSGVTSLVPYICLSVCLHCVCLSIYVSNTPTGIRFYYLISVFRSSRACCWRYNLDLIKHAIPTTGLPQLTNQKRGEYYGLCSSLPLRKKRNLGIFFLYKAFQIFLQEGERQIKEEDLWWTRCCVYQQEEVTDGLLCFGAEWRWPVKYDVM